MAINLDATLERMDGMTFTHGGVHGVIRTGHRNGMTFIEHHASARGRKSAAYREARRVLGDDYISDLSGCDNDRLWAEVERRGLVVEEAAR